MKILIAEDDKISARILERSLSLLGHETSVVHSGTDAWQAVQSEHFPVLITDWMMPGIEGPELCRMIRERFTDRYTYLIVLTARGEKEDQHEAMKSGADDFLSKPLDRQELEIRLAVAERILSMQQRMENQNEDLKEQQADLENARLFAERALLKAETAGERFSLLFEGQPVACFTIDLEWNIREVNRKSAQLFNKEPHELIDRNVFEILGKSFVNRKVISAVKGLAKKRSFEGLELTDGNRFLSLSGHALYYSDGTVYGGICNLVDNTILRTLQNEFAALATTDGLTKIPNHRAFQERLTQLAAEGKRGRKFCLAVADVDFFKRFNDDFGHQAGDDVLIAVASTLQNSIREVDFAARYGGEEFCALLTDVDEATAVQLMERVRIAIESIETPYRQITASFGVAEFGKKWNSPEELIKAADSALYYAKETGRNRISWASLAPKSKAA